MSSVSPFTLALITTLVSCQSGSLHEAPERREPPPPAAPAAPPVQARAAAPATAAPVAAPAAAPPAQGVEWKGNITWRTWQDGLSTAVRESKPILVLVYADWCPHCRALGPVFADPEIETLSKRLVMVRQNNDEEPTWLQPYNQKFGGYVPRIFFFDSNGKMREDLTSGHPRYPFFYAAEASDILKRSMRRAIGS